jgi:hypothetical protein
LPDNPYYPNYAMLSEAILTQAIIDSRSRSKNIRMDALSWLLSNGIEWAMILEWPTDWIARIRKICE